MRTEWITSREALLALRVHWEDLFARCPEATPFSAPGWVLPWWETFGNGALQCAAVWDGDRLAAFAPMFLDDGKAVFIGRGVSDYLDVLVEEAALPSLLDALATIAYDLSDLPPNSALLKCLPPIECCVCPVVDLNAWDLPKKMQRDLRAQARGLATLGEVQWLAADASTLPAALEDLFRLHEARWEGKGVFAQESVRDFHRRAATRLFAAGLLRCWVLTVAGRTEAVIYGFARAGRFYSYISGYNPELSRFGLGSLMLQYAMERCREEGTMQFDFLRGVESYKYIWGANNSWSYRVSNI